MQKKSEGHENNAILHNKQDGNMTRCESIDSWRWGAVALKLTNIFNHTAVPRSLFIQKVYSTTTILDSGASAR